MSLLRPTPGEVIDRLLILNLKTDAYNKSGRGTWRFSFEARELREYLEKMAGPDTTRLTGALAEVHQSLWDAEDKVRSLQDDATLGQVARQIAQLNDQRLELIHDIDHAYGVETTEKKIYNVSQYRTTSKPLREPTLK